MSRVPSSCGSWYRCSSRPVLKVLARRTRPWTSYPFSRSSSARYEPSWPVMPVTRARRDVGADAECARGGGGVEGGAGLAVGFRRVPAEFALEPAQVANQLDQFADGNFPARADIHRVGLVVAFRGEGNRVGGVADEEEFARR